MSTSKPTRSRSKKPTEWCCRNRNCRNWHVFVKSVERPGCEVCFRWLYPVSDSTVGRGDWTVTAKEKS